jgi:hypothetical protein
MRGRSLRVLAAATVLSAVVMVEGAAAQSPPTFGGGRLPAATQPTHYRPTVTTALQPRGGRIAMLFDSTLLCTGNVLPVQGSGEVAWNGTSFRFKGRSSKAFSGGRLRYRWTMTGQVSGQTATGKLHIVGRQRSHRCTKKPTRPFELRVAGPRSGAPAKPAARAFLGGTSAFALFDGIAAPVMLRVSNNGSKVASQWTIDAKCGKGPSEHLVNFTPGMRIRPDGSFSRAERFSLRYTDAFVRYRPVFSGHFTSDGASGTLRLRASIYNRRHTKLLTRCDSGVIGWNATAG